MNQFSGLTINEAKYDLPQGKGKIAVFLYSGTADPKKVLDAAITIYVENNGYHELIDYNLDNPWMRVILSDVNSMKQEEFDPKIHRLVSNR